MSQTRIRAAAKSEADVRRALAALDRRLSAGAAITNATTDHASVTDAPTKAALDALGAKLNEALAALRAAGLIQE